jgi:O-antigen ligase
VAEPAVVARGHEGIVRYDPTGSVVMHSSLSLIHLVLAATRLGERQPLRARLATLALGGMSLSMVFLTATRTALLTLALLAALVLVASPELRRVGRHLVLAALGFGLAFAAWTYFVDDSFYLRLSGGQADFTSGRWSSVRHWLALAGDHPWGMGLGAVRELLADGRPALDGTEVLEWPHNELVRFYLEAGPPGLLFVLLLLAVLLRRALRAAAREEDPVRRMLVLAIAADLVAEACLQNLLNAVYHATVLILILTLAIAVAGRENASRAAAPGQAPAPMPC